MYRFPSHQDWNEFQWEAEIRKDELRISRYFSALASCLDLPGEEDSIYKRLMAQPELVPTGVDAKLADMRDIFEDSQDEDDEEWENTGDWRRKPGTEACRRVEYLASEWNALVAGAVTGPHLAEAVGITCLFGRLLSRVYNLTEGDASTPVALRVSLLKRVLADVNDLLGALSGWSKRKNIPSDRIAWLLDQLQHFREAAVDSLSSFRANPGEWAEE